MPDAVLQFPAPSKVDANRLQTLETPPVVAYLVRLAPSGRRAMAGRLKAVAALLGGDVETLPWHELRYAHVLAIRTKLAETCETPATANMTLSAVRGVVKECFNLGYLSADEYQRIANVTGIKGTRLPAGRCLTVGEITALLETCDDSPRGHRDAALLCLMYAAGLRRSEAVSLNLDDYDAETGELRVTGKGNKQRQLWVRNGAADALENWLQVRGDRAGALFTPIRKGGNVEQRRMTAQAVYNLLRERAQLANVKPFSPHDLRRSFVSELLDRGADIVTVQKLAGHANVQTTARYDRRGEETKKRAVELLHVPYRKP